MRRSVLLLTTAAMCLTAAPAVAVPPDGSHGGADAQNTSTYDAVGPSSPGLAFSLDLGYEMLNEPHEAAMTDGGLVTLAGRFAEDVADIPGDQKGIEMLEAIDVAAGEKAWDQPALDVAPECVPAATSTGWLWVQNEPNSDTEATSDAALVALDAATGERVPGVRYAGEESGDERLRPCAGDQVVLTDDEETVVMLEPSAAIRTIDVSDPQNVVQRARVEIEDNEDKESAVSPRIILSEDSETIFVVSRWFRADRLWRIEAYDLDLDLVDTFDLDGAANSFTPNGLVAADGGVSVLLTDCGSGEGNSDECVVFLDFDGTTFSERWRSIEPNTGSNNYFLSLAVLDEDRLVGWSENEGSDISAINLDDGTVDWISKTDFSNNKQQLLVDAAGNTYHSTFGGPTLVSLDVDGQPRWEVPQCRTGVAESTVLAAIAPDGTVVTQTVATDEDGNRTELVQGFATDGELTRGDCPTSETRADGLTRVETAIEVSNVSFPTKDSADTVVIAVSTNYPDALAGGPLARFLDAPLLLTEREELNAKTRAEIERLGATTAVLLGGTVALSEAVATELSSDMGLTVDRIAGTSRFDTARLVAVRLPASTDAFVTEGRNAVPSRGWPDAVAVSALASLTLRPILLVERDVAPAETLRALRDRGITDVEVVGGEVAVSQETAEALADPDSDGTDEVTVSRTAGASRYDTSVKVAELSRTLGASTLSLWFATGRAYPDALTAGPAAAQAGGILVLVDGGDPDGGPEVYDFLRSLPDDEVQDLILVGGTAAVSSAVATKLSNAAGFR